MTTLISGLRDEVKSWKEVYWRLWGAVNVLYCHRCGNYFQCSELGHCRCHPMTVDFGNLECAATKIIRIYPCCQQRVLHFDPSLEGTVSKLRLNCTLLLLQDLSCVRNR
ncbi:hypothetical protein pdam_00010482, partial [Pocillopora damicornis]